MAPNENYYDQMLALQEEASNRVQSIDFSDADDTLFDLERIEEVLEKMKDIANEVLAKRG